jgi:peroxiredoxin
MSLSGRFPMATVGVGLLALVLILTGCVGQYTPEEAAAKTATISAYKVPTKTPNPETPVPQPTKAGTPTPVSASPQDSPVADLPTGTQPGQLSPDFTLKNEAGQPLSLSSLRGQPVVVAFWASWCPHCQEEMPLLQEMHEQYAGQGLQVVGISVPGLSGETQEKAVAWVKANDITFPIVFDEDGRTYTEYQVQGVPNLFFIDRDGVVVANYPGAMAADRLENQIKQLLEEG